MKTYHEMLADRIWFFIRGVNSLYEKREVRNLVNRKHNTFFSTPTLFNKNVRVYLERKAAEKDCVLVNENGYIFVRKEEDWAYRVLIRRMRMHTTLGLNMGNPGAGLDKLRKSEVRLYQELVKIIDSLIANDELVQMLLWQRMALIKEQDAAGRKLARETVYNHVPPEE